MCGITGFIGQWPREAKAALCFVNSVRGTGGFGCCWLHEDGNKFEWRVFKTKKSIIDVLRDGDIPDEAFESEVFLAHTRNPSAGPNIGGISDRNSHPFKTGKVIAAHNGFVYNYDDIAKEMNIPVPKVDSEIIPELINANGVDAIGKLGGAISTWFVEDGSKKVNLWCWQQDLAIWNGDERGVAFSSDYLHFAAIGIRTNGKDTPYPLDRTIGQLLTFESLPDSIEMTRRDIPGKTRAWSSGTSYFPTSGGRYSRAKAYQMIPQGMKECFVCDGTGKTYSGAKCDSCDGSGCVDTDSSIPSFWHGTSMDKTQKKSYARARSKLGKMVIHGNSTIEILEALLGENARYRLCDACNRMVSYAECDRIVVGQGISDRYIHRTCNVLPKGLTLLQSADDVCEYAVNTLTKHPMHMLAILGCIRELEFLGYVSKVGSAKIEQYLYDKETENLIPGFSEMAPS